MSAGLVRPLSDRVYRDYILTRIDQAQQRVLVSMFIVDVRLWRDPDQAVRSLLHAIARAKLRNVDVKVLIASSGTVGISQANQSAAALLQFYGVPVRLLPPTTPSHIKCVVIDDEVVLGSHNWESGAFALFFEDSVAIQGNAAIVKAVLKIIGEQWAAALPLSEDADLKDSGLLSALGDAVQRQAAATLEVAGAAVPVDNLSLLVAQDYFAAVRDALRMAQQSVHVVMFYLAYPKSDGSRSRSKELLEELIRARGRGLVTTVVLDRDRESDVYGSRTINKRAYELLLNADVAVTHDTEERVTHSKVVIVDDAKVFVGTHNWTHASLSTYQEISVAIGSADLARYYVRRRGKRSAGAAARKKARAPAR